MAVMTVKKKTFTLGTCSFDRISPSPEKLTSTTKAVNVYLSFEDALKLNLAIDEAVRKINSYNRATKAGKAAAVNVTIYLHKNRITVNEGKVK